MLKQRKFSTTYHLNETRYNQTESTSFKRSHGKIANYKKTPSKIQSISKHSSNKKMSGSVIFLEFQILVVLGIPN